jgi:hypothetical protein
MKNLNKYLKFLGCAIVACLMLGTTSCKKENDEGGKGAPAITRVRTVSKADTLRGVAHQITLDSVSVYDEVKTIAFDSTTTTGKLNNLYAIIGENLKSTSLVTFNGVSVYFNPALVTDNSIIVSIPATTPWAGQQSNKLAITTKYGQTDFNFTIQQPAATILNFAPLAAGAGDIVTITGTAFNGVTAVNFVTGAQTIPAQIIGTPTPTEIKVAVPAGIVQARIAVTTPGGTSLSAASFGFRTIVFDDALAPGWSVTSYSATTTVGIANVKRGTSSLQNLYTGGYGAFRLDFGGAAISTAGYSAIKISIYGGPGTAGKQVKIGLNDNYNQTSLLQLSEGSYTDFTIPLSAFGNPATIFQVILQEFSGNAPSTIYVDDIGFI